MKKLLFGSASQDTASTTASTGLLVLRLFIGVAFMVHGYGKIMNPFGWMGPDAPVPGIFQALAALAEFGGGLAWVLGLLVPLSSLGILVTMTVAALFHINRGDGFVGGWELAYAYWAVALLMLLVGPGRFSLDAKIGGARS